MADYFALLSRAVASLDHNTKEARDGLYNRARTALQAQLRNADPPWSDADVKSEAAALEAAIRQIEFEIRRSAARSTPPPQAGAQTGTQTGAQARPRSGLLGKLQPRQQKRGAPPVMAPEPERKPAEDADETPFSLPLSPAALAAIGAIALAVIGAGTYAYVSRSNSRAPAVAANTDPGGGSKPAATPAQPAATPTQPAATPTPPAPKPASAAPAKSADTTNSGLPYLFRRQLVYYRSTYPPGTLIINKSQHTLYEVRPNTVALQYSIGIGSSCENVAGLHKVLKKEMWPPFPPGSSGSETPQTVSQHRPESKLGARAIYLSDVDYGIHGTTAASNIGKDSSFGCFMLVDDDIADLYERANVDTRVVISN
jgi:lipoprotein-anchoring transpeptidase ErfK/SrfK